MSNTLGTNNVSTTIAITKRVIEDILSANIKNIFLLYQKNKENVDDEIIRMIQNTNKLKKYIPPEYSDNSNTSNYRKLNTKEIVRDHLSANINIILFLCKKNDNYLDLLDDTLKNLLQN